MALTALAGSLSYLFWSKLKPSTATGAEASATSNSTSTSSSAPAVEGRSSAANLPNQPQDTSTSAQKTSTNRVAQRTAPAASAPRRTIADILEGVDLSKPGEQERVTAEIRQLEEERKLRGIARARELGLPVRLERQDGGVQEVVDVDETGNPVYFTTHNTYAAVTTRADALQVSPYSLTGILTNGVRMVLGVWDGGSARTTHQEFRISQSDSTTRISNRDGAGSISHATHVAGTMIGLGYDAPNANAKGMAPAARVNSWDWNSDKSEMQANAATSAVLDTNKILISNHSYGYLSGWVYVNGGSPYRLWDWYGDGTSTSGFEFDYGRYNTYARDTDSIAAAAPFYLMFRSAGNDRTDNPATGQSVGLSAGATSVVSYSSSIHPAGDGSYRGGYETIGFDALAKNVVTVGSVADAVNPYPTRDVNKAIVNSFSCWGPTDDGRIKPDLVANGDQLYSAVDGGDNAYAMYSGTSMSSPNAAGTAALVAQQYIQLFNQAMRASTLKGVLIHTADDRGNPGPDYQYGWGLINGQAAADLVRDHHTHPTKTRLIEGQISSTTNRITHAFSWDGTNPIRVTLAWTDPAGTSTTTSDLRTARLINNLDVKLIAPNGTTNLPYVMPFVGNWTQTAMASNAVSGTNNTDNVEQVYLASPTSGTYRAEITFQGSLSGTSQFYSLLISGSSTNGPGVTPLTVTSVSPSSSLPTTTILDFIGTGFTTNTTARLTQGNSTNQALTNQLIGETLRSTFNLTGATPGSWNVVLEKPAAPSVTLTNALQISRVLWCEGFDGPLSGWSNVPSGATNWFTSSSQFYSRSNSYFCPGPSTRTNISLQSPTIAVPAGATNLQLRFWHNYNLQSRRDAARLELSTNNGTNWFLVESASSGVVFVRGGYNNTLRSGTQTDIGNAEKVWTGNSSAFVETILNFTNHAKFAGKDLRLRWSLVTDSSTASSGWYVDSVALLADIVAVTNLPPNITMAKTTSTSLVVDADSTNQVVTGTSIQVVASSTDDGDPGTLRYNWSATGPGTVQFDNNQTLSASNTVARFSKNGTNSPIGEYEFTLTVADSQGASSTTSFGVQLERSRQLIRIEPPSASLKVNQSTTFTAKIYDQFDDEYPPDQQPVFRWSANGGGILQTNTNNQAVFIATQASSTDAFGTLIPFNIIADEQTNAVASLSPDRLVLGSTTDSPALNTETGGAQVTITATTALVTLGDLFQIYNGNPKIPSVATQPPNLTYSLTFDGSSNAPSAAGSYLVYANITDPSYQGSTTGTLKIVEPASDGDGDGLRALLEYAFGGSEETDDRDLLPSMQMNGSTLSLTAVVRTNLWVRGMGTTDLLNYTNSNAVTLLEGVEVLDNHLPTPPAGFQRRTYEYDAGTNASRAFLKLTIQQQ